MREKVEEFDKLMKEYDEDLKEFGFGGYMIDFSDVKSLKDIEALCKFIRKRNKLRC